MRIFGFEGERVDAVYVVALSPEQSESPETEQLTTWEHWHFPISKREVCTPSQTSQFACGTSFPTLSRCGAICRNTLFSSCWRMKL